MVLALSLASPTSLRATITDDVEGTIRQFLAQSESLHEYQAERWLEAETGGRHGWIKAVTTYAKPTGFRYDVMAEGGSGFIRNKILRAVLDAERSVIQQGEAPKSMLGPANYTFCPNGVNADGLANVSITPRRKERVLVDGTMFLRASDGKLVRVEGRLAKSPSIWVKHVDLVRYYDRIGGATLPVALDTHAQLRPMGTATLTMKYTYLEVNGQRIAH